MLFRKLGLLVLFKIKTRQQNKVDKFDCEVKVKNKYGEDASYVAEEASFSSTPEPQRRQILRGKSRGRLPKCRVLEVVKHGRRI